MSDPVICFGQQPNGFFPKRFFYSKVVTARRLRQEIGGRSDHDNRETSPPLRDLKTGEVKRLAAADFRLEMYRRLGLPDRSVLRRYGSSYDFLWLFEASEGQRRNEQE